MGRKLPPFSAIRAFEAAARLHSFKAASEELCVTQSAISHQIKALEQFLNSALFFRNANGMELTHTGLDYYDNLTLILDQLDHSTKKVRDTDTRGVLSVCATPAFTSRWLLPRMRRFNVAYPDIELELTTTDNPMQFPADGVDILIQYGTDSTKGLMVDPFLMTTRYPVCSPGFRSAHPAILEPKDLAQAILLRDIVGDDWNGWFQSAGDEFPRKLTGPRFAHCELTLRAAEEGHGVALAYGVLIEDQIERGTLVKLFDFETMPKIIYSITCLEGSSNLPRIAAFRNWAFGELNERPNTRH
jgi:LysR family glycine cleavage system transcriptional activator